MKFLFLSNGGNFRFQMKKNSLSEICEVIMNKTPNSSNPFDFEADPSYNEMEDYVFNLIREYSLQGKIIDFGKIVNVCAHDLKVKKLYIINILDKLQKSNRVVFQKKIIRNLVLKNETRKIIYQYILKNPGSKYSEILNKNHLTPNVIQWNLMILLRFDCIQEVSIRKTKIYGDFDISELEIISSFFKKDELNQKIIQSISTSPKQIKQIETEINEEYNKVFGRIRLMTEIGLVKVGLDENTLQKVYFVAEKYKKI